MYADIAVDSLVDIACGTGHYLREFVSRGYSCWGVDLNHQVCEYTRWRAKTEHHDITVFQADMADFVLPEPCHVGINFFDSITYLTEMPDLRTHLDAAAQAIVPGGLYIIEFGVIDHFDNHNVEEIWTENRRNASVTATYLRDSWINPITHTFEEQCSFSATCREHTAFFQIRFRKRALYFEEFETLVRRNKYFAPVAYYDDFNPEAELADDLDPWRVVAVLRRN